MKAKGILLAAAVGVGFLTSCEEFDTLFDDMGVTMKSGYYEVEHCIPPSPAGVEVAMEEAMDIDVEQLMIDEGYDNATINSVKLSSAVVSVSEKSTIGNLDVIDYLNISISNESMPEELIATCQNDSVSGSEINMEIADVELKEYLAGTSYTLTNYGMLREATTDTLWVKCKVQYEISLAVSTGM